MKSNNREKVSVMANITVPADYSKELKTEIAVDQVTYKVGGNKMAVLRDFSGGVCYVVDAKTNEAVFSGEATGPIFDPANKIEVYHFDFTPVNECGEYYIAASYGISYNFSVSVSPYRELTNAMVKALYFQRCGMALEEKYAGEYAHPECHNFPAYLLDDPDTVIEDVSGGWHDAGDYGKYITPANQTVFNMMYAYELFGDAVGDQLNIPESGNGLPDILNECKYELDWMLKMQAENGGVYHKVSTEQFAGNQLPHEDIVELQCISPITITATGGFAAAMAAAYRNYKKFYPEWSDKCLDAAKRALDYALANYKDHKEFKNVPPCVTGGYGDLCCLDEIYWGAAELFRATGDKKYEDIFREFHSMKFSKTAFGAYHQGGHGSLCYLLCDNADPELYSKVKAEVIAGADKSLEIYENDGYNVCLAPPTETEEGDYYWGSNAALTNSLANMVTVAVVDKTDKYDEAIADSISYLMGRNYISKCYVTGFGSNPVMNPHHRPSMFDGVDDPVPGLIAGGPNDRKWQRPTCVKGVKQSEGIDWDAMPPAGCYIDWEWNWTANEITIYWNSSCFYITGYLNSKNK